MLNDKLFSRGEIVAVALSGGKDSMCLLHLLLENQEKLNITVKAINVEHGIRGESSVLDSEFVKTHCKALNLPLKQISFDCKAYSKELGLTLEEGARKFRYDYFSSLIKEGFCDKVATAHHLSDTAETVLLNLFRGTSPSGLKGIPEISREGKIIRPLLGATREEIDCYVQENSIPYVTDESNLEEEYTRNFIRINLIPLVKTRFPEMEKSVARLSKIIAEEDEYLSQEALKGIRKVNGGIEVKDSLAKPIFSRACVIAMKGVGIVKDYEKAHIDALFNLLSQNVGAKIDLKNGVSAIREYGVITLYKKGEKEHCEFPFEEGEYFFKGCKVTVSKESDFNFKDKKENEIYLDGDKVLKGSVIRFRKDGDVFTKFGGGTKNLGDYMTDKKIPLRLRESIPLVAYGNEILAICGVEISEKVRISDKSTSILKILTVQID